MAVSYVAFVLALAATVFASCPEKNFIESFDKSELVGHWVGVHWPKYYDGVFKCGLQKFRIDGNHLDYIVRQYNIAKSEYTNNTGEIWQLGSTSKFYGHRDGLDDIVKFTVTGISPNKWIVFSQCRESNVEEKSFSLKKKGVELSAEDEAALAAALPEESSYYSPATYGDCP